MLLKWPPSCESQSKTWSEREMTVLLTDSARGDTVLAEKKNKEKGPFDYWPTQQFEKQK